MKVLQINCVYRKGSTGKIVYDIHTELEKRGIESVVCYGRGERSGEPRVYKTCPEWYSKLNNLLSRFTGLMYGGCFFSTTRLIRIIKREKPDIVHLHCLNGYFVNIYRLVTWLKRQEIKTVLTLHAEFMHTANCGYAFECEGWKTGCGSCPRLRQETGSLLFDRTHASWRKMEKAFRGFGDTLVVTSVSSWLRERAEVSPILRDKKHEVVFNGLDTDVFSYRREAALRAELGLGEVRVVFHATPAFTLAPGHNKGGYYINELAWRLADKGVKVVVAGPYTEGVEPADNVILLGRVADRERLAALYSMADVTVLASERETFSMVTAESLACGTPVVGFEAGAPETIALRDYSAFVPYGDVEALAKNIERFLEYPPAKEEVSSAAAAAYAKEKMAEDYIAVYIKHLNGNEVKASCD
ncbi:MAG: glycosyltransferase [Clostridia bacterium]|nr:glycosyltransferase [Clostridia bacterium]